MSMSGTESSPLVRWGIIGCGDVTEVKSGPAYQQTAGFELAAVMRRDTAKARDYAQRHGVPKVHTDAAALIQDPEIDAVYIATPPDSHRAYALQVAAAGKPCCVEKPMAPSYGDCVAMTEAFRERNLPLFVAYYRRSLPRFNQVKTWLDEGAIGRVRHVSWHLSRPPSKVDLARTYNWRTDAAVAPGGYFDDVASHGLDLFLYLLGEVTDASGCSTNQQGLYDAKDAISGAWLHASGATGSGFWNFGAHQREEKVQILGSEGSIEFSVFGELPLLLVNGQGRQELVVENPVNIQLYHVRAMQACLQGGGTHPSTGATATRTSWLMDRILGRV